MNVSKAIAGLRKKKGRANRHFIPFSRNIRFRDLINHLEGSLVETLTGWQLLCVLAKELLAPLRLLVAEAKVFGVAREVHCMPHIQSFIDNTNIMSQLDKWFEDNEGEDLMVAIRVQLAMMEKNMAVGWTDGLEEPGEEIESESESDDEDDSSDSADDSN